MLGLFGKKSDHPMADLKSAQDLLQGLPKNDALKALQEISAWIESVHDQTAFRLDHQFAVLRLLDEAARPFARKLVREYYASTTLSTFHENRLWMALDAYYAQVIQACRKVHARYSNDDKGASALKSLLPLITMRGLIAVAGRLKAAAAHYVLMDETIWGDLAAFYTFAETHRFPAEQVALYEGSAEKTSVNVEFSKILIWYASCFGALNRVQTHLAERLISYLSKDFTVSSQRESGSRFAFDLLNSRAPLRLGVEILPQPSLRFLGVGSPGAQIDSMLKTLEKNIVPEQVNLGGVYEAEAVYEVLLMLSEYLLSGLPIRRNARHNIKASLSVAKGFPGLLERIKSGESMNGDAISIWQMEDISTGGMRCVLPPSGTDGVVIGMLVGVKQGQRDQWGVGIVRRLIRDQQNSRHVGIELLTSQVIGVRLRGRDADDEMDALWLDNFENETREVDLLMGADTFTGSRSLYVELEGRKYLLIPLELVEAGDDYDWARFRKIEQETSSDEEY
ncbi:MAG: hypothetical protein WDM70_05950 [Nitrosomonadales bacterium]